MTLLPPDGTRPDSASSQEHRAAAPASVRVAVITVSDTRQEATDQSGAYLHRELLAAGHQVVARRIVRDDAVEIRSALVALTREATVVLVTGGTGVTGRDVTVPVVESLLTKPMPGFGELFRMLSYAQVGGAAMFSRATAGLVRGAAVFSMPGSLNAVQTAWEQILKNQIGHVAHEVQRHGQPLTTGVPPVSSNATGSGMATGTVGLSPTGFSASPERQAGGTPGASGGLGRHSGADDRERGR